MALAARGAFAQHPPSVTIEQHWDLLAETRTGNLVDTTVPIQRGILPGGTSGFAPQPTASLVVQARHTGAVNSTAGVWWLRLKVQDVATGAISTLASQPYNYLDNTYSLRETPFTWPATDKRLVSFEVTKESGSVPSTFDLRRAYISIRQQGTSTKTIGRVPLATKQEDVTATSPVTVTEPSFYDHVAADFDPAPTVRLRASGAGASCAELHVHLASAAGTAVTGSEVVLSSGSITSQVSGPLSLTSGTRYKVQAWTVDLSGGNPCSQAVGDPTGLYSVDLVLEQSTADAHGIAKTVGWYPGVTAATDATSNNQALNSLLKAAANNVPASAATFEVAARRTAGTGTVAAVLSGVSGVSTGSTTSGSYVMLAAPIPSLPAGGTQLDTKATLSATGTIGRYSMSRIRHALTLHDLIPPEVELGEEFEIVGGDPYLSPGTTSAKQDISFTATLYDFSPITWSVAIKDSANSTVRTLTGSGPGVSATWDGRDNAGQIVDDGTYSATLDASDSPGNAMTPVTIPGIIVDTIAPVISPYTVTTSPATSFTPPRFSPTAGGTAAFSATLNETASWNLVLSKGTWTGTLQSGSGTTVSKTWSTSPHDNDGTYTATVIATDLAGNKAEAGLQVVRDTTGPAIASFQRSNPAFSPNDDGVKDDTVISANLSDDWTPLTWSLEITRDGSPVYIDSGSLTSSGDISVTWDGSDSFGAFSADGEEPGEEYAADGVYTAILTATDDGTNVRVSSPLTLTLDTREPSIVEGSLAPRSGLNLVSPNPVSMSTVIKALVEDPGAGLTSQVEVSLLDLTAGSAQTPTATISGGVLQSSTVTLVPDHLYKALITLHDLAGNAGMTGHSAGFAPITVTKTNGSASITRLPCQMTGNVNITAGTQEAICPANPASTLVVDVSPGTVEFSNGVSGPGVAFVKHDISLLTATLEGQLPVLTQAAFPGESRAVTQEFTVPDATIGPDGQAIPGAAPIAPSLPSEQVDLGRRTFWVPAAWTSASLGMDAIAVPPQEQYCVDPDGAALQPCNDPLMAQYLVVLPEGSNPETSAANDASDPLYPGIDLSPDEYYDTPPSYVAMMPPTTVTAIKAKYAGGDGAVYADATTVPPCDKSAPRRAIKGTNDHDQIWGKDSASVEKRDIIYGRGGRDNIKGRGGKDRICGGSDQDGINGGSWRDKIDGGSGDDFVLVGGIGSDLIWGGFGVDGIFGGPGDDFLYSRDNSSPPQDPEPDYYPDLLVGGDGSDTFYDDIEDTTYQGTPSSPSTCPGSFIAKIGMWSPPRLRLKTSTDCRELTGTVDAIHYSSDGDFTFQLVRGSNNWGDVTVNRIDVEFMPRDKGHLPLVADGASITVKGLYVKDTNHDNKLELHPVYKVVYGGQPYFSGPWFAGSPWSVRPGGKDAPSSHLINTGGNWRYCWDETGTACDSWNGQDPFK